MAPSKTYKLVTTNTKRTKAAITEIPPTRILFNLDLSCCSGDLSSKSGHHSIVMHAPASNAATKPEVVKSLSTPIYLGFDDT